MKLKRLGALALSLALTLSLTVIPAAAVAFTDVPSTYWGYEDITKMSNNGYAKGYENGTFKPDGVMTAAETLLFCARATGVEANTQAKIAADRAEEMKKILPENMVSWASKEMAVAVETGVLSVAELTALSDAGALSKAITRENICMYLVRAMQLEPLAKSLSTYTMSYKDASSISASLQPYVYLLTTYGIVKGTDTGSFDPKGSVTRAQMTTMLSRALAYMETAGIETELPEYTTYNWQGGTIATVSTASNGNIVLTLTSDISGNRSYSLPTGVKIYENNKLAASTALKAGQYARVNLSSSGSATEVRLGGALTTYTGTISSLKDGQLSVTVGGTSSTLTIDRFTEIMVGKTAGDRSLIDEDAGYTSAVCYVDELGHLAGVKLSGGTQLISGLVESVTTVGSTTTLGVSQFNGIVYRYTVPAGIAVTVNGVVGSLSGSYAGKFVQVRVSNDTGAAASVAVDTVSQYVQGSIKRLGTTGTARTVYISDFSTGKEVSYNMSQNAVITYDGKSVSVSELSTGWFVTVSISGGLITMMDGYSASASVEGVLSSISYGTTTVLSVTQADDSIVTYNLDVNDLPTIVRSDKTSSLEQLKTGDHVVLTIRYNKVEKIAATPQSANLTGTITKISFELSGATMELKLTDGTTATYTVTDGVSVTQGTSASNLNALKPGYTVGLVTKGDQVVSIDITNSASASGTLTGTVLLTSTAGSSRTITIQATDSAGITTLVTVNVKDAKLMALTTGASLSLSDFKAGDSVQAFGAYDGAAFVATIVIKQ